MQPTPELTSVIDPFGRQMTLQYGASDEVGSAPRLISIVTPEGTVQLSYNSYGMLSAIVWPDGSSKKFLYEYESSGRYWLLTGVIDETGKRLSTYDYDVDNRAISTQQAGGVNGYLVQEWQTPPQATVNRWYDPSAEIIWRETSWSDPSEVALIAPNGTVRTIQTVMINGMSRISSQSQPAAAGCAASVSSQSYDANGNVAWKEDFTNHRSCYANDLSRNLETARVDGLMTGSACGSVLDAGMTIPTGSRKTSTQWHPD